MSERTRENRGPKKKANNRTADNRVKKKDDDAWIWGIHPVLELLKIAPKQLLEINILERKTHGKIGDIEELALKNGIVVNRVETLINETAPSHQGVEARSKPVSFLSLSELLGRAAKTTNQPLFLVLDSIQDPHNLGAIIRTASAAGVNGIILPKDRSAPMSGTVAKTAVGAMAMISLCQVTNLSDTLKRLKDENFWIYGADGNAEQDIHSTNFSGATCLVIGSEGKGIRPLVKKQCDHLVKIPMHSSLDSLNASVATGVILFEMVRQRKV